MPPTHRTGSPSGLLPHFRCKWQDRKAPALLALLAGPGLFLLRAGDRAAFSEFQAPGVCSPFLASPYSSVLGSKLFTARCRPLGLGFAPHSPLALIPPSRGANFFLPGAGGRALGLLPLPRQPLFLRPREQTFSCPVPAGGPRVCSPLPASPYDSVQGSKLFPARCRRRLFWAGFLLFSVPRFALENRFHWLCGYPGANRAAGRADFK